MNKRIISVLLTVILSVFSAGAIAFAAVGDTGTYMNFSYKVVTDTEVTVTSYTGSETQITVPSQINGYTVTKIGNAAFRDLSTVESIVLPDTLTSINDVNAFWFCRSLKTINLPAGLSYIGTGAFSGCSSLEEIVIPDGITTLSKTFRGCTSLEKVVIPDSVTSIDRDAFLNSALNPTGLLTGVTIYCYEGSYAQTFASENGIACVASQREIKLTYVANSDGENTVTVTGVQNGALIHGDYVMPETIDGYTVTRINYEAFKDQTAMTSFTMPDTVTEISFSVFWACSNLTDVKLSKNLTGALNGTFGYCSKLENVNIPSGVTSLRKTFMCCGKIKQIALSPNITTIDVLTFQSCIALRKIYLPQSINQIAGDAFLYCSTMNITAYVDSMESYAATVAQNLNMLCVLMNSGAPFVIENRETLKENNKPKINIRLTNNNYFESCIAYAALYSKDISDGETPVLYDTVFLPLDMECGETRDISFVFTKDFSEGLTYKIIILDENLKPLLNTVERALTDKNTDTENYTKMNLFESNSSNSSWDKAISKENFGVTGWTNLAIYDANDFLPYEAYRSFPEIRNEKVTLDFDFSMSAYMDDTRFCVLDGETVVVGFVTSGTYLYLEQQGGQLISLAEYTPYNSSDEDSKCYVRAEFDLSAGRIDSVRINGNVAVEDVPLTNSSNKVDGFDVTTGIEAVGRLINRQVRINSDYIVNEDFNNQFGVLPGDWQYESNGSQTSVYEINSRIPDRFSIDVDTSNGSFKATKSFESVTGNTVFEVAVLQPQKRSGLGFALKNDSKSIASVSTDGEGFVFNAGELSQRFYMYRENVWYVIKVEVDLINSKADIYINNKKMLTDVALDPKEYRADNFEISATENSNDFIYDDVKVYKKRIIPDDYVPEPVIPVVDKPFVTGVQVCNLWTEGQYNKSWDYVKSAPNRLPVFGAYDEGNPEMNDWEIKWLSEHGIDYELIWAYPNIKYSSSKGHAPIKPNVVREGHYIFDGFMNAEYSDKMKFAVSFENSTITAGIAFADEFFADYVPYWIEYYFKDDRYLKIDSRPIFGIYSMDNFLQMFGTMGEDVAQINAGIARFRQMCIDAGVGDPYIISHGFGYSEATFSKYSVYDIDCIGLASWPKYEAALWQKSDIKAMARYADNYNMDFIPTLQPKQDLAAWEQQTGFRTSGQEFSSVLTWARDELPSLMTGHSLSKKIFNFLTWNEYGEGHMLMPTNDDGFTYLDCIRSAFIGNAQHTDVLPDANQAKRIDRMVRNDRLVTTVRENPLPPVPENPSALSVKKGWYFSSGNDYSDWSGDSSASVSHSNGKLVVTPLNNTPEITLSTIPDMELFDVTYVKIRMKGNTTSCGGNVRWTNTSYSNFDNIKRTYFESRVSSASTVSDYYVPIGQNVKRIGKLTGFKIMLGQILDKSQTFRIESIELLRDPVITNGTKIVSQNKTIPCENDPVYRNGTLMVPLRDVVTAAGAKVDRYAHDNSYVIYDNLRMAMFFKPGETTAMRGNIPYVMPEAPYAVSGKINDTVYVPVELIENALKLEITWEPANKILTVDPTRKDIELPSGSNIVKADYFNSVNYTTYYCSTYSVNRMVMGETSRTNSRIVFKTYFAGTNTADVDYVAVRLWSSVDSNMRVYFSLNGSTELTNDRCSQLYPVYRGMNTYMLPVSAFTGWTAGTLNYLRIDPIKNAGEFEIDYVALVK